MKFVYWFPIVLFLLCSAPLAIGADAPSATAASGVLGTVESHLDSSISNVVGKLQELSILWLSSFVLLQFLITNLGLLKSGADLEAIWAKLLGSLPRACSYLSTKSHDVTRRKTSSESWRTQIDIGRGGFAGLKT